MRQNHRHKHNYKSRNYKRHYRGFRDKIKTLGSSRGIYRSRRGLFMGVCRGLSEFFNFNVFWVRMITLFMFLITGFWPIGVMYIVAGLILKVEPATPLRNEKEEEFYDTYTYSKQSALQRIKRKFDNIERRIQRMEHTVTSREFDWK
jgi:phage shock protein C